MQKIKAIAAKRGNGCENGHENGRGEMTEFAVAQAPAYEVTQTSMLRAFDFFASRGATQIFVLCDPFVAATDIEADLHAATAGRFQLHLYSDFSGEPKLASVQAAMLAARSHSADAVLGIGGGSALDMAKIVKSCLRTGRDVADFVMQANPLPPLSQQVPSVMIPTTAGTGSEASGTNIMALENGNKGWVWGPETRPCLALLDPHFSTSLPASLTAWTGMDALVHAFEAATNRYTHPGAQLYAHQALRLAATALPVAVAQPDNLDARTEMLVASYYAGRAIDMCSTSISHALSHALASLAPINHGLATALAFEISLPFVLTAKTPEMQKAAAAFGVAQLDGMPEAVSAFMDSIGIDRQLPAAFDSFSAADLMAVLLSDEIQPMREACVNYASEADLLGFAKALLG